MKKIIILVLILAQKTFSNYADTFWGMSLEKVKELYPKGIIHNEQNGDINYNLVKEVSNHPNANLQFLFDSEKKLKSVFIIFPKLGTDVDLENRQYIPFDNLKSCKSKYNMLKKQLTKMYGKPSNYESKNSLLNWMLRDKAIFLTMANEPNNKCAPILNYDKPHDIIKYENELSKGL